MEMPTQQITPGVPSGSRSARGGGNPVPQEEPEGTAPRGPCEVAAREGRGWATSAGKGSGLSSA